MSNASTLSPSDLNRDGESTAGKSTTTAVEFHYSQTDSFEALLRQLSASLLVTTYHANKQPIIDARTARGLYWRSYKPGWSP